MNGWTGASGSESERLNPREQLIFPLMTRDSRGVTNWVVQNNKQHADRAAT